MEEDRQPEPVRALERGVTSELCCSRDAPGTTGSSRRGSTRPFSTYCSATLPATVRQEESFFLAFQPINRRKERFALLPPMEAAFVPQCQAKQGLCTPWPVVPGQLRLHFVRCSLKIGLKKYPVNSSSPLCYPQPQPDLFCPQPQGLQLIKAFTRTSST